MQWWKNTVLQSVLKWFAGIAAGIIIGIVVYNNTVGKDDSQIGKGQYESNVQTNDGVAEDSASTPKKPQSGENFQPTQGAEDVTSDQTKTSQNKNIVTIETQKGVVNVKFKNKKSNHSQNRVEVETNEKGGEIHAIFE